MVAEREEELSSMYQNSYPTSGSGDRYAGVRTLWLKVIIRAIFDWVTYRDSPRLMQKKLAESAASWLFEDSELFNGFENICGNLDVNPEDIRERARAMSKDDVAKIEHLERSGESEEKLVKIKAELLLVEWCNEEVV